MGPSETGTGSMAGNGIARNGICLQRMKERSSRPALIFSRDAASDKGSSALRGQWLSGRGTTATVVQHFGAVRGAVARPGPSSRGTARAGPSRTVTPVLLHVFMQVDN